MSADQLPTITGERSRSPSPQPQPPPSQAHALSPSSAAARIGNREAGRVSLPFRRAKVRGPAPSDHRRGHHAASPAVASTCTFLPHASLRFSLKRPAACLYPQKQLCAVLRRMLTGEGVTQPAPVLAAASISIPRPAPFRLWLEASARKPTCRTSLPHIPSLRLSSFQTTQNPRRGHGWPSRFLSHAHLSLARAPAPSLRPIPPFQHTNTVAPPSNDLPLLMPPSLLAPLPPTPLETTHPLRRPHGWTPRFPTTSLLLTSLPSYPLALPHCQTSHHPRRPHGGSPRFPMPRV
jgi:hypothetical protein